MDPILKSKVIKALRKDRKIRKGVTKYSRNIVVHLTEEQYRYLDSKRKVGTKNGLGSYMRKLLIIDMERNV